MTLGAGYVFVGSLLGKLGMALLIVIKVEPPLLRFPGNLRVATLASHQSFSVKPVRLILLVAATTEFILPKVDAPARFVLVFVAILALQNLVLIFQWPAGEFVIKPFLASLNRAPTHHVEAPALVIKVAICTRFASHFGRRVIPKPGPNALF